LGLLVGPGLPVPCGLLVGLVVLVVRGFVGLVVRGLVVLVGLVGLVARVRAVPRLLLAVGPVTGLALGGAVPFLLLPLLLLDRVLVAADDLAVADLTAPAVLRLALDGDEAREVLQV